jgi:hypothetical protein
MIKFPGFRFKRGFPGSQTRISKSSRFQKRISKSSRFANEDFQVSKEDFKEFQVRKRGFPGSQEDFKRGFPGFKRGFPGSQTRISRVLGFSTLTAFHSLTVFTLSYLMLNDGG